MLYYLLAVILVVIDQLVKAWVRGNIPLGESIPFLPHVMDLAYVQNTGAAFSFFSQHTWLLTLISLAATVLLALAIWRRFFKSRLGLFTLTLLLAGAAGNLIDRALLGFVTDMFKTTFMDFAVFNVADICVTVGGVLLVVCVLFVEKETPSLSSGAAQAPEADREGPHDAP